MKRITQLLSFIGAFSIIIYSCSSEHKGYKKSESGIYYKFHHQFSTPKAKVGDELTIKLKYSVNDSLIFNSDLRPIPTKILVKESGYTGDIHDCLKLMTLGDSASFIIEADSFFLVTVRAPSLPKFIKPKSKLHLEVKILNIKTKEDLELEINKRLAEMEINEKELTKSYKLANKLDKEFIENTGIFYKEIKKGSGKLPNPTDIITVKYEIKDLNGRMIFSSSTVQEDMSFECMGENPETEGFNLVISKMIKGQKASFVIPSKYAFADQGVPNRIEPYTAFNYTIEIIDIENKTDFEKEKMAKDKSSIDAENEKISSYIQKNNISEVPRESGLYYIETLEGSGRLVKEGDNVKVHYTLYNLDGKIIDSSVDRGTPFAFKVGEGQVITGWDEALTLMKEGGKATLIIPSKIAYKDQKRSEDILPYTPLLFEVELLEIVK